MANKLIKHGVDDAGQPFGFEIAVDELPDGRFAEVVIVDSAGSSADSVDFSGSSQGDTLAITTSSAQTAAITGDNIVVWVDTSCNISVGTNPTASVNSFPLLANTPTKVAIDTGDKLAAIAMSGTGNLYYHPVV